MLPYYYALFHIFYSHITLILSVQIQINAICDQFVNREGGGPHLSIWLIVCVINSNVLVLLFTYTLISTANSFIDYLQELWSHFPDYNFKKAVGLRGSADWALDCDSISTSAGVTPVLLQTPHFVLMAHLSIHHCEKGDCCISICIPHSIRVEVLPSCIKRD